MPLIAPLMTPYGPYRMRSQESYEERTKHFREQLAGLKEEAIKEHKDQRLLLPEGLSIGS